MAQIISCTNQENGVDFTVLGFMGIQTMRIKSLNIFEAGFFMGAWFDEDRPHIQNMPEAAKLTPGEREFFVSGVPEDKFDEIFAEEADYET